ncbi:MAG: polysaccharide deacetylase family protein [Proteobacteria bacterium]|nr:polysaccharide deacetylase family protein [Pseudomonadota bacterium]
MKFIIRAIIIISILFFTFGGIIHNFPTDEKLIAITFDACETKTPAYFDKALLDFIIKNQIPVTLFLSGKFIERNKEEIKKIGQLPFIEIENHSYSHSDFRLLSKDEILNDIIKNGNLITDLTGKTSVFFRFPYGYYDKKSLEIIEKSGYKIVHWSFESGDPDKSLTKERLVRNTLIKTKRGSILIFHINGRGWKTKEAFPEIMKILTERGYKPVLLKDVIR